MITKYSINVPFKNWSRYRTESYKIQQFIYNLGIDFIPDEFVYQYENSNYGFVKIHTKNQEDISLIKLVCDFHTKDYIIIESNLK